MDTSMLPYGVAKRVRDEAYRRYIATLRCLNCFKQGDTQAAHESYGNYARSLKAGDDLAMPLCTKCHRLHDQGHGIVDFWLRVFTTDPEMMMSIVKDWRRAEYAKWVNAGRPKE